MTKLDLDLYQFAEFDFNLLSEIKREVICEVLGMDGVSFRKFNLKLLTNQQRQQILEAFDKKFGHNNTSTQFAFETLCYQFDWLTAKQVQQLVDTIVTNHQWVYFTVRACYDLLNPKQFQQLINEVAPDELWSTRILQDCYDSLTPKQVKQLSREKAVITNDFHDSWMKQ
ncbi:MAG: hypothetical protein E6Q36_00165 [Chryseobacterium sp.]|nr:MAG: hypothetical protein E6Q36_00165 [Chryseobacterium sp.]